MPASPLVLIHVCSATVGLLSGFLAMIFRKGSGLHRVAGNVFFVSMLCMTATGAYMGTFMKPNRGNVAVATLAFYMVATGWVAGKRRERTVSTFDTAALLLVGAVAMADLTLGLRAAASPTGAVDGYPAVSFFIFGSVAVLFALSDVRMIVRGGVAGAQRIARHVLRMGLTLFLATLSFYPGQAKLFSTALRQTNLLYVPLVLVAGSTIFWLVRVLSKAPRTKRSAPDAPLAVRDSVRA